ncbi:MAG: NAD(P)-dependent oxidoreductase [Succinivibrio sp.]|nr:NAD(P)-dependent oxidoreductase [Succinivibrio sp.]
MKVAIIGATGKAGRAVLDEALKQGHEVTALVRNPAKLKDVGGIAVLQKDIADLTRADLIGFDAVINCFGTWSEETLPLHSKYAALLCDALSGSNTRLLVVGGAGSLYVNKEHTLQVYQTPDFPQQYLPTATAQVKELDYLRARTDVKWTFLSPAGLFDPEGPRTGQYTLGGEELILNQKGESYVSYADYALALVDELKAGKFIGKRFSVVSEH